MSLTNEQLQNRITWVRALLSGDYKQGRKTLKRNDGHDDFYCCLGVACELVHPTSRNLVFKLSLSASGPMMDSNELEAFGMSEIDQRYAAGWNDNYEYDFNRIADLIAYATENGQSFSAAIHASDGFAVEWLSQFD